MSEKPKKPLTVKGFFRLQAEYKQLFEVERPKIVQGVADAAAEGDRSENAEYIYGRKRLRELDKRLRYLTHLLDNVQVINVDDFAGEIVCFGSTVVVTVDGSTEKRWTIVGEGETDLGPGLISWRSPMGHALLGKSVGSVVEVETPAGIQEVEILELWFGNRRWKVNA